MTYPSGPMPANPIPGADIGTWGQKINEAMDWLRSAVPAVKGTADAAETPTGAQTKATTALNDAKAYAEAKVPRTGAAEGYIVTLKADGTLHMTQPAAGTTIPDASPTAKGIVQLTGDLGGSAIAPTTPTALHKTGDETAAGIKTFTAAPVVPDGSWSIAKTTNLQTALDVRALLSVVWTGGTTRVTGGYAHLWSDPNADPGTSALEGDLWVGDQA